MRDVVDADASVLLGDWAAEKAERRHLAEHVLGEGLVPVALARARRDLLVREVLRELTDRLLLGGQVEVHGSPSLCCEAWPTTAGARCARRSSRASRPRSTRAPEPRLVRSPSVCATTFCAGGVSRSRTAWRASSSDARVRVGGALGPLVRLPPAGADAPRAAAEHR